MLALLLLARSTGHCCTRSKTSRANVVFHTEPVSACKVTIMIGGVAGEKKNNLKKKLEKTDSGWLYYVPYLP